MNSFSEQEKGASFLYLPKKELILVESTSKRRANAIQAQISDILNGTFEGDDLGRMIINPVVEEVIIPDRVKSVTIKMSFPNWGNDSYELNTPLDEFDASSGQLTLENQEDWLDSEKVELAVNSIAKRGWLTHVNVKHVVNASARTLREAIQKVMSWSN